MEVNSINTSALSVGGVNDLPKNTVSFKVEYPEGYEGGKYMPDGSIQEVAPDAAEYFESLGIGKTLTEKQAAKAHAQAEEEQTEAISAGNKAITTDGIGLDAAGAKATLASETVASGKAKKA